MVHTQRLGRLGILAVGLGIGAAVAHGPVASADSSTDPLWWLGGLDVSPAAPGATAMDFQISFNGTDLFPTLDNTASAETAAGQYGLAIAYGDGASAYAGGGTGDYALADGTNAFAAAGSLTGTADSYDTAVDIGNSVDRNDYPGTTDGSYAGGASLTGGVDDGASSHDSAYDIGNNGLGADGNGGYTGAFAGDGGLLGGSGSGNGDTAYDFGNNNGETDGAFAYDGDNNSASLSGSTAGDEDYAFAGHGDNNSAIADTSYTNTGNEVYAEGGNSNYAYVDGPDNSTGFAGDGNSNIAYVSDPFAGATGAPDDATAGGGSNDLAEVLYTHGDASVMDGNYLYDIITLFGNEATPAAATSGSSFLTELLGLL